MTFISFIGSLMESFGERRAGRRLFYLPEPGVHRVVCQDDQGNAEVKMVISE